MVALHTGHDGWSGCSSSHCVSSRGHKGQHTHYELGRGQLSLSLLFADKRCRRGLRSHGTLYMQGQLADVAATVDAQGRQER
jgi:hypothetical protein